VVIVSDERWPAKVIGVGRGSRTIPCFHQRDLWFSSNRRATPLDPPSRGCARAQGSARLSACLDDAYRKTDPLRENSKVVREPRPTVDAPGVFDMKNGKSRRSV
jgi:hypothetical protein